MSDRTNVTARRYFPQVIIATLFVALLPVAIVWLLRARGVISAVWLCVVLAIVLSLIASYLGSAYWTRRDPPEDVMFSELLLWGWVRRLYLERKLAKAADTLGLDEMEDRENRDDVGVQERARLLSDLAAAVDALDPYTVGHSRRVTRLACELAQDIGLSEEQMHKIKAAAAVHDVGKLRVPRSVLNKPDKLTPEEFELVKRHAKDGAEMVACLHDEELTDIVLHHHERIDGRGYPEGLASQEIPIGSRIVAVADTYDAIIATRPYRPAAPHKRALDVLRAEAGKQLDSDVVHAFLTRYSGRRGVGLWAALSALPLVGFGRASARTISHRAGSRDRIGAALAGTLALLASMLAGVGITSHPPHLGAGQDVPAATAAIRHVNKGVAAPVKPKAHGARATPSGAPAVAAASPAGAGAPASTAAPAPGGRVLAAGAHQAPAPVIRSSTCQAYNPQLCTALAQVSPGGPGDESATSPAARNGDTALASTTGSTGTGSAAGSSDATGASGSSQSGGSSATSTGEGGSGRLPFTGIDVVYLLVLGGGLLAGGLLIRRRAEHRQH